MSKETLVQALQHVSVYLAAKNTQITLIAVGGVVNTLLLENRVHTRDVDFFNDNLTVEDTAFILQGARYATKMNRSLEPEWLNNHTVLFIPVDIRRVLTSEAFTQNEIVFDSPSLRLIAAPWEYLFCTKVDRITRTGNNTLRPYDQTDAIYYLRRHLSCSSISGITLARLRLYFARYRIQWTDQTQQVVAHMNNVYRITFNVENDPVDLTVLNVF